MVSRKTNTANLLLTAVVGIIVSVGAGVLIHRQQTHYFRREMQAGAHNRIAAIEREAAANLRMLKIDAVLLDCQMPRMDGYEATRAIRELPGPAAITPVIALTANAMQGDRDLCIAAGMDDYIAKPLDGQTLAATLDRWVRASTQYWKDTAAASL